MNLEEQKIRFKEKNFSQKRVKDKMVDVIGYTSEDAFLADCMCWAKNTYPQIRKAIFHIENEGDTSSQYARMKGAQSAAKGKLKGVFDVCCVFEGKLSFAEFKLPKGVWSIEQKELQSLWSQWQIPIYEIRTFDSWKNYIEVVILKLGQ